jgi:hypothetical protein
MLPTIASENKSIEFFFFLLILRMCGAPGSFHFPSQTQFSGSSLYLQRCLIAQCIKDSTKAQTLALFGFTGNASNRFKCIWARQSMLVLILIIALQAEERAV